MILESPTILRLDLSEAKATYLKKALTYCDKKVQFEINRIKNSSQLRYSLGVEEIQRQIAELQTKKYQSLLMQDENGYFTYTGIKDKVANLLNYTEPVKVAFTYPEPELIPWEVKPPELRDYQQTAVEALLQVKHGAVELATGSGKSLILLYLIKKLGLKTVLVTPSINIANQMYDLLTKHFGKKYVGQFYEGKKESDRRFVVAVAASLTRVEEDSEHWEKLSEAKVVCFDEAHTTPARTLAHVALNLFKDVPYRFFVSGTQTRTDGLEMLLNGLIGPIVTSLTVQQGVDQGYLSKPVFKMISVESSLNYQSPDPGRMTRKHFFYNPTVNKLAADLANKAYGLLKRPVLILVDEVEQFSHLLPHFKYKAGFAHSSGGREAKDKIPPGYQESDPSKLVEEFNDLKLPILVGTSCIATGSDTKATGAIIYLRGGTSEIEVKQGIGRGTRLFLNKTDCLVYDFDVINIDILHRHANARRELYREIYPSLEEI